MWARVLLALVATLAAGAPTADAAVVRPPTGFPSLPQTVPSPHFVVHYTTAGDHATSPEAAATLSANAETAYRLIVETWGYPPPKDDGDGRTDLYIANLGTGAGAAREEPSLEQSTSWILVSTANLTSPYPIAHEFFHAVQMGIYAHEESWLDESTAEWAGQNVISALGMNAPPNWYDAPWVSLNCGWPGPCDDHDIGGYRGSIFMEYLDERHGMTLVHEVYTRAAQLGAGNGQAHSMPALSDALAARGSSVSDEFLGYALAASSGQINRLGVTSARPRVVNSLVTGTITGPLGPVPLVVDHLAFTNLLIMGQSRGTYVGACADERLSVEIALPPGIPTQPAFVSGTTITPLTITGGVARGVLPWSDCSSSTTTLVVPNGSTTADDQPFPVMLDVRLVNPVGESATPPTTPVTTLSVKARAGAHGKVTLRIRTAVAGKLTIKATTRRNKKTRTYATAKRTVKRAGTVTVVLRPTTTAARLLRTARKQKLTIAITFRPKTGRLRTVRVTTTVKR